MSKHPIPATLYRAGELSVNIWPANGETFTLEEVQALVGGYVQSLPVRDGYRQHILCNEDAKALGLPLNRPATDNWLGVDHPATRPGRFPDEQTDHILRGTVLFCPIGMFK